MRVKRIRSGRGLGDTLYMQAVVRHLVKQGVSLEVCTDFPEIFNGMPVTFDKFSRHNIDYLSHYTKRKHDQKTNQWEDICISAGVEGAELKIDWHVKNHALIDEIMDMADGRKILLAHGGRPPMNRKDGFGMELLPDGKVFNFVLDKLDDFFRVRIGDDSELLYILNVDKNLNRQTSVEDMLDIASIADGFVGQCSYVIPLAESFDKKLLAVWSSRGLESSEDYVRTITPRKILSKPSSLHVVDDWNETEILKTIDAFRNA